MHTSSSSWEGHQHEKGSGNYWRDHLRPISNFTGIRSYYICRLIININRGPNKSRNEDLCSNLQLERV